MLPILLPGLAHHQLTQRGEIRRQVVRQQRQVGAVGQLLRQRQSLLQDLLHALFELRRMGGAEEQAVLSRLQLIAQRAQAIAACGSEM